MTIWVFVGLNGGKPASNWGNDTGALAPNVLTDSTVHVYVPGEGTTALTKAVTVGIGTERVFVPHVIV